MSELSYFLAGNAVKEEVTKFAVSERFLKPVEDDAGNPVIDNVTNQQKTEPVEWELAPITSKQSKDIKKSCTKRVPSPVNKNIVVPETDFDSYLCKLAVACVQYPDLNNADLQDSYSVVGAENLIQTMLKDGEYQNLLNKIQEINGFDIGLQDKVNEAKN
ncbi:MAG: XkdN-like protein [Clostridiaceae bacterium]|jgi:hypothetical protein|nr:XkdN-like protein [Clostridiaceae bacterium]